MDKFVILDRDGTLIEDKNFLNTPTQIRFMPKAIDGLRLLQDNGFQLFVVSNQSGVARGYLSLDTLRRIDREMTLMLKMEGIRLRSSFYCPHHPNERCGCRKPRTWLGRKILRAYGLSPSPCGFVVGDSERDLAFGLALGLKAIKIGKDSKLTRIVVNNLLEAAERIITCDSKS
ncbi:MAG: hypothetical protein DRQ10_04615 [Candidatus Hydrothermota bacterium]|nr:MAG: hypothetical protein DRQ10_04615 [Candidatus Hydrothermae bacterium]